MTEPTASAGHMAREAGRSAFGTDPEGYHAGRLGYPDALYDALFARCVARPDILEIAAGTGIATEAMLARDPASLTLVEADNQLAAYLGQHLTDSRVTIVNGTFPEAVVEGSFDLAVTAAAFHWMEAQPALAKAKELLRPSGIWSMWWNSYRNPDMGDAFADATVAMLANIALPPSMTPTGHYSLDVALHAQTLRDAGFINVQHHIYRRERMFDAAQMRMLYASYSFVRVLPQSQAAALLDHVSDLVDTEFGGQAPNIVLTAAYSAERGPDQA